MGANPKPDITWFKGNSPLPASPRIKPSMTQNGNEYLIKLEILNFTKDDGGQYKVTAKNEMGEGNANITINLEGPKIPAPTLSGQPEVRLDDSGKNIIIKVGVVSPDMPEIQWFLNAQPIKADRRIKFDCPLDRGVFYPSLKLGNFTDKDSGVYKIVMKNVSGECVATATVNVDALKPKPKGEAP